MMTALYRRYRPDTFAEVIGQEHVTKALQAALANGRINHAYLFSGPRGCGKTTSARIMARCLNCAEGPTPNPCGKCESCRDLATGGPGSLDVVEIDAASNGGVDDARELRERATFAPVRDRFKIYILDEAHMVTAAGFNALLKLVEEPPEHVKFIFATTEPDKVIGTIRSRTHHYPFRLVAPEILRDYLAGLCEKEGVQVEDGVLGLAVRAGGGSVRDSLSILDQLIAGEPEPILHYERAVALLGYTDSGLLQALVDGLIAGSGADAYGVVDRMIQTGHDPRRFVEDLLQYFRNLVVLRLAGANATDVLGDVPAAQLKAMQTQVTARPPRIWTKSAEQINDGLSEMVGASSPRLSLELLVAKLLLEFGLEGADSAPAAQPQSAPHAQPTHTVSQTVVHEEPVAPPRTAPKSAPTPLPESTPVSKPKPTPATRPEEPVDEPAWEFKPTPWGIPGEQTSKPTSNPVSTPNPPLTPNPAPDPKPAPVSQPAPEPTPTSRNETAGDYEAIRSRWGEIMEILKSRHALTESLLSEHGQLQGMRGNSVEIAFQNQGMLRAFGERHTAALAEAIATATGQKVTVTGVVAGFGAAESPAPAYPPVKAANPSPTVPDPTPVQPATTPEMTPGIATAQSVLGGRIIEEGSDFR